MVSKLNMDQVMGKAEILIEALPYIQRYAGKIMVIKYGGSVMENQELKEKVIQDVAMLKLVGFRPVVVHGGGNEISKWSGSMGLTPKFIDGLRVTDSKTLKVTEMVLYSINQELVSMLGQLGVKAVGLSGRDAGLIMAEKRTPNGVDMGYVGKIVKVNTEIINGMLKNDLVPVISPIGMGEDGHGYNINGDEVACEVAKALKADKLAFLTDADGLYEEHDDPDSLISEIYAEEAKAVIEGGGVVGGMLPKLENCIGAVESGVSRVHILNGNVPHCVLLEFFSNRGVGTAILSKKEKKYYHE
jgi:acetylglutamate kinase